MRMTEVFLDANFRYFDRTSPEVGALERKRQLMSEIYQK
jgi:hypothetical protein